MADAVAAPTATRHWRDLPGPRGVPVFGSALAMDKSRVHEHFAEWSRRYGPYVRVRIGPRRLLLVSDHAVIARMLRDRPDHYRRPTNQDRIVREMGFAQGLFFANDDAWRRQRRMVMAALDPTHVKAFVPTLLTVVERLRVRWEGTSRRGAVLDLQAELMRYTVDVIAGLAFGSDVNTIGSDDDVIQRHLNLIFPAISRRVVASMPYWRWIRLPADRALERAVREVNAAIAGFIAGARARLEVEPERRQRPRDLLEAMIVAAEAEPGEPGESRADDVAGNVFIMLVAGEDTTANTLAWLLDFLFRHPDSLARAREEVLRVAPDHRSFTLAQIGELEFVDACIQETMRLKPVAPLIAGQAVAESVVGDVAIDPGTFVVGVMRHDATDATHFPDPLRFDPERWLGGAAGSPDARSPHRVSMPFGAGPRLCPGRYLALVEMKMLIAMLLANFELESVGTADGSAAREVFAFAMGPAGLRMRLAPRVAA
ncbi:MAG: cytochrome P450 [Caldimonas sp.]